MNREKWQDDILNSVNGLNRAEPNPFLFTRIKQRLQEKATAALVPRAQVRLAAIGLALLCVLNMWIVLSSSEPQNVHRVPANSLAIFPGQLY